MSPSVVISFNRANPKEYKFVTKLLDYLSANNIEAIGHDPNFAETEMKQWLLNAKWLILFLTPEAIRSPQVQSLVNAAFVRVKQGLMQGVLALALSSNPVDLEAMPSPSWSTIRIYYTGEMDEDQQQVFEKLSRTMGYPRVPVPAASSSTNNWASSFSSAASRPLPAIAQSSQRQRSGLPVPLLVVIALLTILVVFGSIVLIIRKPFATSSPKVNGTTITHSTPTIHVTPSPSVTSNNSTPTPPTAQERYDTITTSTKYALNDSMSAQDDNQWYIDDSCNFINGMYQVSSTSNAQYKPCIVKNMKFKDFAFQVDMKFISGNRGGLIFRSNDVVSMFYLFSLNNDGQYSLLLCNSCTHSNISNGKSLISDFNDTINQPYTLTVIAFNKSIYLYINGMNVGKMNNATIQEGKIGVFAASENLPTIVAFSNLKVWNLTESGDVQK